MAKNKVTDWDTTAANNTDIGGTGILGSNAVSNFDDAIRSVMAQVAAVSAGTYPLKDTFSVADPADLTKIARFDCGGITTSTTRVLTVPDADGTIALAGSVVGSIVKTVATSDGTWTKNAKTLYVEVELVGGGGGGGGVDGQGAGTAASGSGGGGGGYVKKFYAVGDLSATEAYTVGAAGAAGSSSAGTGGDGGNSTFKALTASGGTGGTGRTANGSNIYQSGGGGAATGGDLNIPGGVGNSTRWSGGVIMVPSTGGPSQMGPGGRAPNISASTVVSGVAPAGGYGGGGSGGCVQDVGGNETGAAGAAGVVIITEYRTA